LARFRAVRLRLVAADLEKRLRSRSGGSAAASRAVLTPGLDRPVAKSAFVAVQHFANFKRGQKQMTKP
jgi:hypothetical protein